MLFHSTATTILSLLSSQAVALVPRQADAQKGDLTSFISSKKDIALQGVLANIGPDGAKVGGSGDYVIASPSKENPDYFYTWTRDSAVTIKVLLDEMIFGDGALQAQFDKYVRGQAAIQTITNPSGSLLDRGLGLGEPKFYSNASSFNGEWGRPQRDGPALRAITLISYCHWLIDQKQADRAKLFVWPVILNDLNYVGQYWNQTGFDLWDEVRGTSFFSVQNFHRALVEGQNLSKELGLECPACAHAEEILCLLSQNFWNGEYIISNINVDKNDRTGLDSNSILGPVSIFDIDGCCDNPNLQPCNSKALSNFRAVINSFRGIYDINAGISKNSGIAVGRYAEDVYQGGNPWYMTTLGAAEFLYDAVAQWKHQKKIIVDSTSIKFFQDLYPSVEAKKYEEKDSEFCKILEAVTAYADSFVAIVQKYAPDGSLSEQFDRKTGKPVSASDLTMSYAAFVRMVQRRSGEYPRSWGSASLVAPQTCTVTAYEGTYVSGMTDGGAPKPTGPCERDVQFNLTATTYFGENIYVVGNVPELGNWDLSKALLLSAKEYTAEKPFWNLRAQLPAGQTISYVYVREQDCNQAPIWSTQNGTLTTGQCDGEGLLTVTDTWAGDVGSKGNC
ncbi:hypothetical protein DSL72_006024 [Monilinia vaccinii-corymbosi]|uniref:Glucoamylase n=1 Tax=Monilinia vaccinii-corymbosi TaxID=61207 RepID=A0A8A3PGL7_9HELO|nr:hypothetical protein DSL72_006024 [Monilinia vaccinii-corymbosi]